MTAALARETYAVDLDPALLSRVSSLTPAVANSVETATQLSNLAANINDPSVAGDLAKILEACVRLQSMVAEPQSHLLATASNTELLRELRHELRTPINAIKGYGEILLEDAEDGINNTLLPELRRLISIADGLLIDIDDLFRDHPAPPTQSDAHPAGRAGTIGTDVSPVAPQPVTRGRILAVDDTPENLAVLERRLIRLGHSVATTTSGLDALQKLHNESFDLVLLDLMMPEISGHEVLARIKADKATANIPVVMISALNEISSVVRCLDAGAEDYLPKPFDPTLLRARVDSCLEKKRLRDLERATLLRLEMQTQILARELDAARRMQQSILPVRYPHCPDAGRNKRCGQEQCALFPTCPGIRLTASMIAAKEVGGDFYEFAWLDNQRLAFAVADVSGKGVPAALFMSLSLALLRTIAPVSNGPADCLTQLNRKLCVDNEMSMFVTLFYGVYDASSGLLRYANAGHAPPLLTDRDGNVTPLPRVRGVALGIMDDCQFDENCVELPPASTLCVYTDGVNEAINQAEEEFGDQRLIDVLVEARGKSADGILAAVLSAVDLFAQGMPQADDITCLVLRRANSRRHDTLKIVLLNQLPEIHRMASSLEEFLGRRDVDAKLVFQLNLVLDEILTNAISYGFPEGRVSEIEIDVFLDDNKIVVRILDFGQSYNPLERPAPDLEASLDERQIGGLGVHFAKTLMDEVSYWHQGDKNCLVLVKRFASSDINE